MQLHRDRERFAEAGVQLAVIGQGRAEQAADFKRSRKVDIPLLADEERATYRLVGTKKGTFGELLGPRTVAKGLVRGLKAGVVQGRIQGHPAQLGGVLVVAPGGSIAYAHLSDDASDIPPNDEVLEAARGAVSAA